MTCTRGRSQLKTDGSLDRDLNLRAPQQFKYRYEIQTKKNKTKQSKRNKQTKKKEQQTELKK